MKKQWMGLIIIFILIFGVRLYFAYQTPHYSSDEAYLHVRNIEQLRMGESFWNDTLGYGGRTLLFSPLFDGILAILTLIFPLTFILKVIPNLFASLLIFPVYFLSKKITKNTTISLIAALIASVVPTYFSHTFNHLTPLTLAFPLFFTLAALWLSIPERTPTILFLVGLLFFVFLHPLSLVFVLSLGVYIILITIEGLKSPIAEYELGLFSIFFALWAQFILYKRLILFHGTKVIWQNMPKDLLAAFYSQFTILSSLWHIGIVLVLGGTYTLYKIMFKKPQKHVQLLFSIVLVSVALLWLKLINVTTGYMLLGITLAILSSYALTFRIDYIKDTKVSQYWKPLALVVILAAIITTAIPAFTSTHYQLQGTISSEEVSALETLQQTTPEHAVIIAPSWYGHYITSIAKRKNIIDTYYYLQPRIDERYQDVQRVYKTSLETEAVELFDKYDATHLVVPPGVHDIKYANSPCFTRIQATNIRIYEKDPNCRIRVIA